LRKGGIGLQDDFEEEGSDEGRDYWGEKRREKGKKKRNLKKTE